MKMLSVAVHEKLAKEIDEVIFLTGAYSSRSEFLKDAIRKALDELVKFNNRLKITKVTRELSLLAKSRGYKGGLLTREERKKIADEYIKENNISVEF